jgi:2-polyprenyl-3-methyl-5-hydroxy-6-metoxy-1,4-benzoquinol methylase
MLSMSLGIRALHPFVLSFFASVPRAQRASLKVLDMPAGPGVLSVPLASAGFDVTPVDLFPEYLDQAQDRFAGRGVVECLEEHNGSTLPGWLRAKLFGDAATDPVRPDGLKALPGDMESRLDFADATFDMVACVEGIEHVMDRHKTLSEMRRVMKPGGSLLITTPNLLSLRARAAYFFAGQRAFKSYIDEYTSVWGRSEHDARIYHGHAFLINYFQLRYSLYHCGFRIERLEVSNWSGSSLVLSPAVPLVALATWMSQRRAEKKYRRLQDEQAAWRAEHPGELAPEAMPSQPPYGEMFRHLLSPAMLYNATMIVHAKAV